MPWSIFLLPYTLLKMNSRRSSIKGIIRLLKRRKYARARGPKWSFPPGHALASILMASILDKYCSRWVSTIFARSWHGSVVLDAGIKAMIMPNGTKKTQKKPPRHHHQKDKK